MQPWHTPFPIWNQSVVPCPVLTVASWSSYRFLRKQVRWSVFPISENFLQFIVIDTVKGFGVVNKVEVDVFLELSCFFDDPKDVGNLISRSSAFSKFSLNIWKFLAYILLKPNLENFEYYFASMWDECNCAVVWTLFGIAFLWDLNENWSFPVLWPLLSFPYFLAYWIVQHFHTSSFRIWNSSTGIPSPPLALFVVMLPKAHLTLDSRMSGLGEWSHHRGYLGHKDLFLYSSVYSCYFFLISFASVRSILFLSFIVPIFAWMVPLVSLIFLKSSLIFPILLFSSISLEGFLISPCYSFELCIQMGVSFLFSLVFSFSSFLSYL